MSAVHPLGDTLLVEPDGEPDRVGLEESARSVETLDVATVVLVGPRVVDDLFPGTTILYVRRAGAEVRVDGSVYRLISEEDLRAILTTDDEKDD